MVSGLVTIITLLNFLMISEKCVGAIVFQKNIQLFVILINEKLKFILMEEEFKELCLLLKTMKLN